METVTRALSGPAVLLDKPLPMHALPGFRDGLVSVEAAARDYGVAIHPDTLEIDDEATAWLRRDMA